MALQKYKNEFLAHILKVGKKVLKIRKQNKVVTTQSKYTFLNNFFLFFFTIWVFNILVKYVFVKTGHADVKMKTNK